MMNNDPESDPDALRRQDASLLRPLDLQVRKRRAPGRGGRHHHPHDAVGRLPASGRPERRGPASSSRCRRRRRAAAWRVKGWVHRRHLPQDRGARRSRPRHAARRCARKRDFKPVPLGVTLSIGAQERGAEEADRQRHRQAARQRSGAREGSRDLFGAPRSSRHQRRTPSRARTRSTTAPSTTLRALPAAGDRRRVPGAASRSRSAPSTSPPSPPKSRASSARNTSRTTCRFPPGNFAANINMDGIGMIGQDPRLRRHRPRQVEPRRLRQGGRDRRRSARIVGRPVPRQGLLLPLRPLQLRQGRHSRRPTSTPAPT